MDADDEADMAEWMKIQAEEDEAAAALALAQQEEEAATSGNQKRARHEQVNFRFKF